jgi:hypothetical protein
VGYPYSTRLHSDPKGSTLYRESARSGALVSVMNAYTPSHEFENLQDRPGSIRHFLKLLVSILSGGDSNWEAGARGL